MPDLEHRVSKLEEWKHQQEIKGAAKDTHPEVHCQKVR